jgi:hypothetical protein
MNEKAPINNNTIQQIKQGRTQYGGIKPMLRFNFEYSTYPLVGQVAQ